MKTIGMIGGMSWESSTQKVQKGVTERKRGQEKGSSLLLIHVEFSL